MSNAESSQAPILHIPDLPDEIFRMLLVSSRRCLMFSTASKEVQKKIQRSTITLTIKITTAMTETLLTDFHRLATLFQIRIQRGVKYQDILLCQDESGNAPAKRMFLACIQYITLSNLDKDIATSVVALLGHCSALAYLNLPCNSIAAEGAARLAVVLGQCS